MQVQGINLISLQDSSEGYDAHVSAYVNGEPMLYKIHGVADIRAIRIDIVQYKKADEPSYTELILHPKHHTATAVKECVPCAVIAEASKYMALKYLRRMF